MNSTVQFKISLEDDNVIRAIVDRAKQTFQGKINKMGLTMDITACHANGNPLRLDDLLAADRLNFAHDVFGIQDHLDRKTGKLRDCFLPRFSQPQP
jgi:hypothetical protein